MKFVLYTSYYRYPPTYITTHARAYSFSHICTCSVHWHRTSIDRRASVQHIAPSHHITMDSHFPVSNQHLRRHGNGNCRIMSTFALIHLISSHTIFLPHPPRPCVAGCCGCVLHSYHTPAWYWLACSVSLLLSGERGGCIYRPWALWHSWSRQFSSVRGLVGRSLYAWGSSGRREGRFIGGLLCV